MTEITAFIERYGGEFHILVGLIIWLTILRIFKDEDNSSDFLTGVAMGSMCWSILLMFMSFFGLMFIISWLFKFAHTFEVIKTKRFTKLDSNNKLHNNSKGNHHEPRNIEYRSN